MTNEENAVAVISLMQEATRREPARLTLESFSLQVLSPQDRALRSFKFSMYFSDGETTLFAALFAFRENDLRVGGHEFDTVAVHHKQTKRQTYLLRRQAHAAIVVHRFKHVFGQRFKIGIETDNRIAR